MGKIGAVIAAVLAGLIYMTVKSILEVPPLPTLEETWWGPGKPSKEDTKIYPFKINVSNAVLKDLQDRLNNAIPLQESLEGVKQHYGMNSNLLKKIIDFWKTKYNWREREKFLNQYPHYRTSVQGLKIHYVHVKPSPEQAKGRKVLPLLLLHGFPGSFRLFYEIIPYLTQPQAGRDVVFEVIVASLPGFGFSDGAVRPGLGHIDIPVIFKNLMKRLKFDKYYLLGEDWGAIIVTHMAILYPEHVLGVQPVACGVNTPLSNIKTLIGTVFPSLIATEEEAKNIYPLGDVFQFLLLESGYLHIQGSKPDTVGVAVRDSPVGMAAYILEKFTTWTNRAYKDLDDGGLEKKFTYTDLLDNVMIYWVSRSFTTATRIYSETFHRMNELTRNHIEVPSGCSKFANDLLEQPESFFREIFVNMLHSKRHAEGGHFSAFELPEELATDVYDFVEKAESFYETQKK